MTRDWRNGSVELVDGYTLRDVSGNFVSRIDGVRFSVEGGFINIDVPGTSRIQLVSAPAVRLVTCTDTDPWDVPYPPDSLPLAT